MSDETSDLDEIFGFLAEDGRPRRDPEEHPSPETLTAYQANELSKEEDKRIQDHLAVCRHCTELLLDLEEFLKPPVPAAAPAADFEAAADWRRLREGVGREVREPAPLRANAPGRDYQVVRSLQVYRALAAGLGILAVGLVFYAARLQGGIEILPSPQQWVSFERTRGVGSSQKPLEIRLPYGLPYATSSKYSKYRVEIVPSDGPPSYSLETSLAQGTIFLKEGSLKPGDYEVRLSGLKDGQPELIGDPQKLIIQP